jgi:hypothetical protein
MPKSTAKIVARTFQLPVTFEFYSASSKWCFAPARVIGWKETKMVIAQEGELYLPDDVIIEVEGQRIGRVEKSLSFNDLPGELQEHFIELGHANKLSARAKSLREYQFEVLLRERTGKVRNRGAEAWLMRDEFLKPAADDIQRLHGFLEKWGSWDGSDIAMLTTLRESRREFRDAMKAVPASWLGTSATTMLVSSLSQPPYFRVITTGCCQAIETTLTIDVLMDVRFGTCARPDCGFSFPIESRHKRKYCCQYCGHLESVRRNRTLKPSEQARRS